MAHLLHTSSTTSASSTQPILSGELLDGLSEALASPPEEHQARAAAICCLVQEMYDTTEWLHGSDGDASELLSLRLVVSAAREHAERMSQSTPRERLSA